MIINFECNIKMHSIAAMKDPIRISFMRGHMEISGS